MEGQSRSLWREAPPTHFKFRIESFSTLSTSWFKRYETCVFSVGDCKWKLALYPNGNTLKDSEDHLSIYLVLVSCMLKNEILVAFNFLLFDQIRGKYLSVQEVGSFDANNSESGIDRFLPLKTFMDPSNGFLVNDTCVFGADIFVMKNIPKPKVHCLSMMMSKPAPYKHTWKVEKFSGLEYKYCYSEKFMTKGHMWRLMLYPKCNYTGMGSFLSVFLELADEGTLLAEDRQVLAQYTLRVVDQVNKNHREVTDSNCFCASSKAWGLQEFCPLTELNKSGAGYLVDDTCIIEGEVVALGSAKIST